MSTTVPNAADGMVSHDPAGPRPIVLLTDYPPDMGGGGAVILQSLLSDEDRERIVWLTPSPPRLANQATAGRVVHLRSGSLGKSGGRARSEFRDSTIHAKDLAEEVATIARSVHAAGIWIVMHGACVAIAARLARRSEFPLHLTVHDDPAFAVALRSRRRLLLVPWIEQDMAYAMRRAKSIDVIGPGMADRYHRRYGVDAVVVHRGLPNSIQASAAFDKCMGVFSIGVMGNIYHYNQLPPLSNALLKASRKLGVSAKILLIGMPEKAARLKADYGSKIDLQAHGHLSEPQAIQELSQCFCLYLNYPFTRRDAVLRQTSFPTKLSTYIQAARPILLHAPGDSSTMVLERFEGYVHTWRDLDSSRGASILVDLWNEPSSGQSFHEPAEEVRREWYDYGANREKLSRLIEAVGGGIGS